MTLHKIKIGQPAAEKSEEENNFLMMRDSITLGVGDISSKRWMNLAALEKSGIIQSWIALQNPIQGLE